MHKQNIKTNDAIHSISPVIEVPDGSGNQGPGRLAAGAPGMQGTASRPADAREENQPDMLSMMRNALDSLGEAVLITDSDGRIQWASKAFYAQYLPGSGSIVGQDRIAILDAQARHFKDPRLFKENLTAMIASPSDKGEAEWELADRHMIIHLRAYPIYDEAGKVLGRVETYREEEPGTIACLSDREVIDSVPTGIIGVDEHLNVVYYNRSGAEFVYSRLGFDPRELKSIEVLGQDHPLVRAVIESLSGRRMAVAAGYQASPETEAYYDMTVTPLASHRHVSGAVVTITDVTGRQKALAEVQQARKYDDFFINLMSHDIRNFNQVSMGYLEMLELSENLNEEERQYLAKALTGVVGSNRLIENVRTARTVIESGHENIVPTDLRKVLQEDIDHTIKAHPGQTVQINARLPAEGKVMANQYIHEIFRHILENAVKYDQHPQKVIDIDVAEPADTREAPAYWTIRITDRGRGIPEDRRRAIFERIGQTTKGSGIGMSMVNMIVNKLGGRIWVEDRVPGDYTQGSVFVVQLQRA
ncbi:putative signal transduction histidine kinase [Methanocella arvoryzae MRE50]|uniref:histidine kinase n=2 Tax=Methanocella TaxID=570266 RepID=Q0W8K1_METAR|nr:putative signal transduction histidine kinase [Methanocella arvoryzae MRE50]